MPYEDETWVSPEEIRLAPQDYDRWIRCPLWTSDEAIFLLLKTHPERASQALANVKSIVQRASQAGVPPELYCEDEFLQSYFNALNPLYNEVNYTKDVFQRAKRAGTITTQRRTRSGNNPARNIEEIKPSVFIKWASDNGFDIPIKFRILLESENPLIVPPYLDESNENYAREIALAIKTWCAVFLAEQQNTHLSNSKRISRYLESLPETRGKSNLIKRLTVVCTPKRR